MAAESVHPMQHNRHASRLRETENAMLTAGRCEHDRAVRKVTRMHVIGVIGSNAIAGDFLVLIGWAERQLPKSGSVQIGFPDPETRGPIPAVIEDHLSRIEREAQLPDNAGATR